MLRSRGKLKTFKLDKKRYTRTLDRVLGQIIREAAREWLRAIAVEVPVETGMAKATLAPLGRFLKNVGGLGINPKRKPYYSKLEGDIQEPATGEAKSDFRIRDDKSNPLSFIYEFEWSTEVLHYWLSEFYNGPAIVGEDLLVYGEDAFFAFITDAINRRLPNLANFIQVS